MKKTTIIQLIGIFSALFIVSLFFFNNQSADTPPLLPKPVVTGYKEYMRAPGLNYAFGVKADVVNEGTAGDVVVEVTIYQKGKHYTRRQQLHARAGETVQAKLLFEEATVFGELEYEIITYPATLKSAAFVIAGIHTSVESLRARMDR